MADLPAPDGPSPVTAPLSLRPLTLSRCLPRHLDSLVVRRTLGERERGVLSHCLAVSLHSLVVRRTLGEREREGRSHCLAASLDSLMVRSTLGERERGGRSHCLAASLDSLVVRCTLGERERGGRSHCLAVSLSVSMAFFFCVPSYSLGFTILGEIFAYVTAFQSNHRGSHIPSSWVGACWMYFCCHRSPV